MLSVDSFNFLKKYLNGSSPVGFEWTNQKIWMEYLRPFIEDFITDSYGTCVGVINPKAKYKVVIEAHADEISWYVNFITDDGLIYVIRNGGSDHTIAPSKMVNIHTKAGIIKGVFGWPAIHTRRASPKDEISPTVDNIFIDVGVNTAKEVEKLGIRVGCVITYSDEFTILNNNKFVSRSLDNKIGGFMIAEVAKRIHANKISLPFGFYIVNAVQEEIGLRGAEMISRKIKPNLAIITDVTHDTSTPMIEQKKHGKIEMGKGPVISYGPSIQNYFRDFIESIALKNNIKFQLAANSTCTGTDTDAFAYSDAGVCSALVSLPLRYMHTTVEMVEQFDVESVIDLLYYSIISLKGDETFSYFD